MGSGKVLKIVCRVLINAVRLPELLSQANIEEETLMELQQKLVDLLKYLFLFLTVVLRDIIVGFRVEKFNENRTLISVVTRLVCCRFLRKNQNAFFLSSYHVPENMETSTNNADD